MMCVHKVCPLVVSYVTEQHMPETVCKQQMIQSLHSLFLIKTCLISLPLL